MSQKCRSLPIGRIGNNTCFILLTTSQCPPHYDEVLQNVSQATDRSIHILNIEPATKSRPSVLRSVLFNELFHHPRCRVGGCVEDAQTVDRIESYPTATCEYTPGKTSQPIPQLTTPAIIYPPGPFIITNIEQSSGISLTCILSTIACSTYHIIVYYTIVIVPSIFCILAQSSFDVTLVNQPVILIQWQQHHPIPCHPIQARLL